MYLLPEKENTAATLRDTSSSLTTYTNKIKEMMQTCTISQDKNYGQKQIKFLTYQEQRHQASPITGITYDI